MCNAINPDTTNSRRIINNPPISNQEKKTTQLTTITHASEHPHKRVFQLKGANPIITRITETRNLQTDTEMIYKHFASRGRGQMTSPLVIHL